MAPIPKGHWIHVNRDSFSLTRPSKFFQKSKICKIMKYVIIRHYMDKWSLWSFKYVPTSSFVPIYVDSLISNTPNPPLSIQFSVNSNLISPAGPPCGINNILLMSMYFCNHELKNRFFGMTDEIDNSIDENSSQDDHFHVSQVYLHIQSYSIVSISVSPAGPPRM